MRTINFVLLAALALVDTEILMAHHSVPVNFDQSSSITVEGVLTEIRWANPHSHFRMDVTDEEGVTVEWLVEMGALNTMKRSGFEMHLFSVGGSVAITGWPGRRDRVVFLNQAIFHNGTELICAGVRCGPEEGS